MQCNVLSIWHPAHGMLGKENLVMSDFTPVEYEGGSGIYTIGGYLATITESQCAVILDNIFNIIEGKPPEQNIEIICDAIKDKISSVLSKTISILEMELRMRKIFPTDKINYVIDDLPVPEDTPEQLVTIQKWIMKKAIIDLNANISDQPFDPKLYFKPSAMDMNRTTSFLSKWDQYQNISHQLLQYLEESVQQLSITEESIPLLQDMCIEVSSLTSSLEKLKSQVEEKITQKWRSNHD